MATISDVAKRADVSVATVSRYLRGHHVRSERDIAEAIDYYGYWPTAAARSLRSGVHLAIALVVPDITNPFFAAVVKGVESVFRPGPYSLFLSNTDESGDIEDALLADIVRRVDGIILAPATEQDQTPLHVREAGLPLVFIDRELPGEDFDSVMVDNAGGAGAAARHLLQLGHQRIAIISGPLNTTPGRERYEGFVGELAASDVPLADEYCKLADFRESGGHQAMLQLLALPERPTAVFCANNVMTIGALKALHNMRVAVPGDVSVIGFDDLDLAPLLSPPLTVIERPTVDQGVLAARLLLTRLADHSSDAPQRVVLPTRLVERGSCSPPRGHSPAGLVDGESRRDAAITSQQFRQPAQAQPPGGSQRLGKALAAREGRRRNSS